MDQAIKPWKRVAYVFPGQGEDNAFGSFPNHCRAVPGMIHYDAAHARQIQREPDTFRLSRLRKGRACNT